MYTSIKGESVSFVTDDKLRLHGFLMRSNPRRCIISIHGMGGNFYNSYRTMYLAENLKGFSTFSINTRGHDQVYGTKRINGRKLIYMGTGAERFEECVLDIRAAIRTLWGMGFRKFVLMGHSTGCQKAAYYQYRSKDRRVRALVLLGPADDYGSRKRDIRKFRKDISLARRLERQGGGDTPVAELGFFSPRRAMSISDLRNVEARIFYYDGKLTEFSSIRTPVCAVFGSEEEYRDRDVGEYLDILSRKTGSRNYRGIVIEGANHSFTGHESELAIQINAWLNEVVR